MKNENVLPSVLKYKEYLDKAVEKFCINLEDARIKYGGFTIKEWEELLSKKYYLIIIEEINGEQEYTFRRSVETNAPDVAGRDIVSQWYEDEDAEWDKDYEGYLFFGGSLMAKVERWEEITKQEYDILQKFGI